MLKQALDKIIGVFIIAIGTIFIVGCTEQIPEGMDAGPEGPEGGEPEGGELEGDQPKEAPEAGADPEG